MRRKQPNEKQIQSDQEKVGRNRGITQLEKILEGSNRSREVTRKRAEELERLLEMRGTEERIKHEQTRLEKGTKIWEKTVQSLEQAKAEKLRQEKAIQSMREKMPDLTLLTSLKGWHMERREIQRLLKECKEEVERYARQLEDWKKKVDLGDPYSRRCRIILTSSTTWRESGKIKQHDCSADQATGS